MKAAIYTEYGPPEVVTIKDVAKPVPKPKDVLVKVHATTVNRNDGGFRTPEYGLIIRPIHGLFRPKKHILGTEFAGVIEAIGENVTEFKIGDEVFGLTGTDFGTHAEYCVVPADGAIALKPANLSFTEATAILDGPWLAWNLVQSLDFQKVRRILINGASGSIGTACVQLCKHFNAEVVAVCGTKGYEVVKSLGPDQIINYETSDFTKCGEKFDAIIDAVGKSSFFKCVPLLNSEGIYFSTELGEYLENPFLALVTPILRGKQLRFPLPKLNKNDILFFKDLGEKGKLRPIIDRIYPLEEIVEAYRYVGTGQKTGNVVIKII